MEMNESMSGLSRETPQSFKGRTWEVWSGKSQFQGWVGAGLSHPMSLQFLTGQR